MAGLIASNALQRGAHYGIAGPFGLAGREQGAIRLAHATFHGVFESHCLERAELAPCDGGRTEDASEATGQRAGRAGVTQLVAGGARGRAYQLFRCALRSQLVSSGRQ